VSLFATDSWLEPVTFTRNGAVVLHGVGAYAPDTRSWYLEADVDVCAGDLALFRGVTRRVAEPAQRWLGAGSVVIVAADDAFADRGALLRPTGGGFDRTTRTYVPAVDAPVWDGPCTITSVDQGAETEVAEQGITIQVLEVETPVALADVRPDDVFVPSASADPRLVGRRLVVTRIQAGSTAAARTFRVIDNQG